MGNFCILFFYAAGLVWQSQIWQARRKKKNFFSILNIQIYSGMLHLWRHLTSFLKHVLKVKNNCILLVPTFSFAYDSITIRARLIFTPRSYRYGGMYENKRCIRTVSQSLITFLIMPKKDMGEAKGRRVNLPLIIKHVDMSHTSARVRT